MLKKIILAKLPLIALLAIGTITSQLLLHGQYIFYNFLILPMMGVVAYLSLKNKCYIAVLGIGVTTFLWQFVSMAADGMFEQKMYLETLSGSISITSLYLFFVFLGIFIGALLSVAFLKVKKEHTEIVEVSKRGRGQMVLRVVSGLIGFVLILGIGSLANAFMGNPVSAYLAHNSAQQYVNEKYKDLNLEVGKASFNFKFDHYSVQVKSSSSQDTHFSIEVDSFGHVENDNYRGAVLSRANTYNRLNEVYEKYAEPYIKENMPYEFDMVIAQLNEKNDSLVEKLEIDAVYKPTEMPMKGQITIYLYSDDLSWGNVAKVTLELDALMEKANLEVGEYTVVLEPLVEKTENKGQSFGIYDFPKEKLKSPELAKDMEDFFNNWNQEQKLGS